MRNRNGNGMNRQGRGMGRGGRGMCRREFNPQEGDVMAASFEERGLQNNQRGFGRGNRCR